MADLVKSVLGGAWSLIIGWILPTYISLQLIAAFMLPGMREFQPIGQFYKFSSPTRQFALLAAAAVAGLVLAAAQAPLYRILEGYLLWPASISNRRIKRHQERHRELTDAQAVAAKANKGVRSGLLFERAARYPVQERQFAPTALGNAIRRFETYARDRYMLDSQLLWHHLTAAAPDRAVAAVDNARANVDFFVCLLYGSSAMAILGIAVVASGHASVQSSVATAAGIVIAIGCYRLALNATGFRAKGQGTSTSFDYVELFPVVDGLLCRFRAGRARLLLEEGLLGHSSSQEPLVSSYPAGPRSVSSIAGDGEVPGGGSLMVAVRLGDLVSPLRNGRPLLEGDRSALVIGGTGKIRGGEAVVFLKVVAVAPA